VRPRREIRKSSAKWQARHGEWRNGRGCRGLLMAMSGALGNGSREDTKRQRSALDTADLNSGDAVHPNVHDGGHRRNAG